MKRRSSLLLTLLAAPAFGAETLDWATFGRIRDEGFNRSQVMDTLWWLTDRHGPRLTNSPQERRASQWAKAKLVEWGLANAAIEPWGEFGAGWSFERSVLEMTAPSYMPLIALPKAWTRGLDAPGAGAGQIARKVLT